MLVAGEDDDLGLSLIELIVGLVVSMIVLLGVASIFVNSWLAQNDVLSTSEATNRGQLISLQIERAIRNAVAFEPRDSGNELWVHTSFDNPTDADPRRCQAFNLGDGKAALMMASDDLAAASWGDWIDDDDQAWLVEVKRLGSAPIFELNGVTLRYAFEIETDSAPVLFTGEVSMRASSMGDSEPCWS